MTKHDWSESCIEWEALDHSSMTIQIALSDDENVSNYVQIVLTASDGIRDAKIDIPLEDLPDICQELNKMFLYLKELST